MPALLILGLSSASLVAVMLLCRTAASSNDEQVDEFEPLIGPTTGPAKLSFSAIRYVNYNSPARHGETKPSGFSNVWAGQWSAAGPAQLATLLRAHLGTSSDEPIIAGEERPAARHCTHCCAPVGNASRPDMNYDDWSLLGYAHADDRLHVHQSLEFCCADHLARWLDAQQDAQSLLEKIPFSFATAGRAPAPT